MVGQLVAEEVERGRVRGLAGEDIANRGLGAFQISELLAAEGEIEHQGVHAGKLLRSLLPHLLRLTEPVRGFVGAPEQDPRRDRIRRGAKRRLEPRRRPLVLTQEIERARGDQLGRELTRMADLVAIDVRESQSPAAVARQHADPHRERFEIVGSFAPQALHLAHRLRAGARLEQHLELHVDRLEIVRARLGERARFVSRDAELLLARQEPDVPAARRLVLGVDLQMLLVGRDGFVHPAQALRDPAPQEEDAGANRVALDRRHERGVRRPEMSLASLGGGQLEPRFAVVVVEPHHAPVAARQQVVEIELLRDSRQRAGVLDALGVGVRGRLQRGERLAVVALIEQRRALEPERARIGRAQVESSLSLRSAISRNSSGSSEPGLPNSRLSTATLPMSCRYPAERSAATSPGSIPMASPMAAA